MADDSVPDESVNIDSDVNANEISDTEDFNTRMHDLPVELFETIRDLVLSDKLEAATDTYIRINRNHKPPLALHITSAVRKTFAFTYYTRNTFTYAEDLEGLFVKFVKSLPPFHRRCIRMIQMIRGERYATFLDVTGGAVRAMLNSLKRAYGPGMEAMFGSDAVLSTFLMIRRGDDPDVHFPENAVGELR